MDGTHTGRQAVGSRAGMGHPANRYPHPATPVPHLSKPAQPAWRLKADRWKDRPWRGLDVIVWGCVAAWAFLDILTTAAGLHTGLAREANAVGAAAYDSAGAMGLLQLKLAVLLGILAVWVAVPWRWRPYVRAGTVAGGSLTLLAVTHNAWILAMA